MEMSVREYEIKVVYPYSIEDTGITSQIRKSTGFPKVVGEKRDNVIEQHNISDENSTLIRFVCKEINSFYRFWYLYLSAR